MLRACMAECTDLGSGILYVAHPGNGLLHFPSRGAALPPLGSSCLPTLWKS